MQPRLQTVAAPSGWHASSNAPPRRDEVLHSLYGAIGNDDRWNDVLRVFAGYFNANISMLVVAGQGQRDQSFYAAFNHREEAARAYSDHWWQHDIILAAVLKHGQFVRGMVGRGSDVVPHEELRASAYYKEFMSLMPAEHFMGCVLSDGSDASLAPPMHLSFFRAPGTDDFSDAEVADLAGLYPHIHRAFELHWEHRSTQEQLSVFHQGLDGMDFGVLFVDPANRVRHANTVAKTMIEHMDWIPLLGGLAKHIPAEGELAKLMQACALGHGGAISLGPDHKRVFVLALPLAPPVVTPAGETRASVMLMLIDPQKRPEAALDFVVRAFSLSKAEARLLPLLFENRTPADIAETLNVKISTVRSQLSAIFAKTGTTRQQELIRLLGALPPIQRLGR